MTRRNRTRFTILGTLTLGPKSGYDIKRFVEHSISNFWRESYGQLYPTLRQLEDEGLVSKEIEDQAGRPARHVYSVTQAGREVLKQWLAEPAAREIPRLEVLLKLFFGTEAPPGANVRHIERFREEIEQMGSVCRETTEMLSRNMEGHPNLPYWLLGLRQGVIVYQALLQWCDEAEQVIRDVEGNDL